MAPEELAAARLRAAVRKQEREAAHSGGSQKDKGDDSSEPEDIYDDEQDKDKED
ncbi:hypothetical protein FRC03_003478 [Tulasnella sp. 419]|nr:hypothetical protein FRC03_003478 [Tulasnella sp. 419]